MSDDRRTKSPWAGVGALAAGCRRRARDTRASAFVEYAVLLGVLVGGGVLVYYSLGPAVRGSFGRLAALEAADADHGQTGASRGVSTLGHISDGEASRPARLARAQLTGWYAALACGIVVWYLLRGRGRRGRLGKSHDDGSLESMSAGQRRCLFEKRQQILAILSRDTAMLFGASVTVRHLMSRDLVTAEPGTRAEEVAEMMDGRRIRHLLVCASGGRLLGIISDRDLRYRRGESAADLMTADPIAVTGDTPIGPAITMMLDRHVSCLPVIEDGVPVGILTTTDLMMSLQCTLQVLAKLAAELQGHLAAACDDRADGPPNTISACAASTAPDDAATAPMA